MDFAENPCCNWGGPPDRASLRLRPGVTRRGDKVRIRFRLQGRSTAPSRQSPQVERESDQSTRERLSPTRQSNINLRDSARPHVFASEGFELPRHEPRNRLVQAEQSHDQPSFQAFPPSHTNAGGTWGWPPEQQASSPRIPRLQTANQEGSP